MRACLSASNFFIFVLLDIIEGRDRGSKSSKSCGRRQEEITSPLAFDGIVLTLIKNRKKTS
ncbi:hypothetical protein CW702_02735 [Candidatus Bathyarchaeota archaeon]|nr:MAG: hypothetical protein CW702_02735 [Candidatus Bathyarchaeota archaeon]